jgi:hypothetical protein
MIIGISGLIGSGKDTVADYLVNVHGFRRESFAGTLKDAVSAVFGWDRVLLEGRTKASREWREQVDLWWAERLHMPHLTPRWVLQYWGTDVMRKGFHDDIWIASIENKIRNLKDNVVISDCRFPNELVAIKSSGGLAIRTKRGPDPEWFHAAEVVNGGPTQNLSWASNKSVLDNYKVHASETAWAGTEFNHVLNNNGTMDELYAQVDSLVLGIKNSQ